MNRKNFIETISGSVIAFFGCKSSNTPKTSANLPGIDNNEFTVEFKKEWWRKYPLTPDECWKEDELYYYATGKELKFLPKGKGGIIIHNKFGQPNIESAKEYLQAAKLSK